nr:hypothetical protein Iba_chr01aCG5910 [Ipomoea batatas]
MLSLAELVLFQLIVSASNVMKELRKGRSSTLNLRKRSMQRKWRRIICKQRLRKPRKLRSKC